MSGSTDRRTTAAARDTSPRDGDGAQPGHETRLRATLLLVVVAGFLLTAASWALLAHQYKAFPGTRTYGYWREGALSTGIFVTVGIVLAARRPRHRVAWVFAAMILVAGVQQLLGVYGEYALFARPGELPGGIAAALVSTAAQATFVGTLVLLVTLFPTGRALGPRWRIVPLMGLLTAVVVPLTILLAERPWPDDEALAGVANPLASPASAVAAQVATLVLAAAMATALIGGIVQLVVRYRRAGMDERLQIKFFTVFAVAGPVVLLAPLPYHELDPGWVLWTLVPTSLPVAIGVALVKHRLYGIDVVISRTLVFGGLAAFITAIYVSIVVGLGSLLGAGDEPNLALSIVATAVVAVAFQPVRERLTRLANRLVFGHRATPYEVLSSFAADLAGATAPELTLERMAKLVSDGTGADRVIVWLRADGVARAAAVWPEVFLLEPIPDRLWGAGTPFDDFDHVEEIRHDGELLGAIALGEPRGESLNHTELGLLNDLAGQAALVLRNLRLTEELRARIADLHASRRRLVQAEDDERRRLERDLHDGAQQQLEQLTGAIRRASGNAEREDAAQAASMLTQVADDGAEAIRTVRDLAHGIYPPVLAAEGLPGALANRAAEAPVPVTIEANGLGRYGPDVEAAVYFCVLEAVNNAAKYADPTQVTIRLRETDGQLTFEVTDDGTGFDPDTTPKGHGTTNMADRLDALDGTLHLASAPGQGTRLDGRIPTAIPSEVRA